jgi:2'-5' RNA ligase
MSNGRPTVRTFFAVSPDDTARATLAKGAEWAAKSCGGRPTRAELIHLTLVFIGSTPRERIADLVALADSIVVPAFDLQLDAIGWFRQNGIVWAGARKVPDPLLSLQASLARGAERLGFSLDVRPYSPHLTLARDAHRSPPATTVSPPLSWRVGSFELMASHLGNGGPRYEVLHARPLDCSADAAALSEDRETT